MTTNCCIQLC